MSLKKISDLFNFEKGSLQSSKCTPGEYDFITASSEWKTHNEYTHECEALIFAAAASGSLGRTHYVNGKFISSDLCFIITPKDPDNFPIDIKFYHLIFETFKEDIVKNTKAGTSKEAIGLKSFGNYKLPYFEISKQISTREQFVNAQISKTEIVSEFAHQLDLVKQLRQAFLREAMQGKLTEKWRTINPDVEPASELLKKVKAEKERLVKEGKLKKDKPSPAIKENEIPFEIPESWEWCRLGEISNYSEAGKSLKAGEIISDIGQWGVIKTSAITSGKFLESENKFFLNPNSDFKNILINKDDILFCRASGSKGLAGKSCIVLNQPSSFLILCDKSIRYHFSIHISKFYIQLYNSSSYAETYYDSLGTKKSTTMNNITREQFNSLTVPLPSYSEQQQIVTKLDELMQYCDKLEESIKNSQQQNEMLLQQVLREALEPK